MPPRRRVKAHELRKMFNDGEYWERTKTGELVALEGASRHPGPPFEPFCTVSQSVHYYSHDAKKVAVVHQYLRPDGTIGGSGQPDPKAIFRDGILYFA
jgi:hypothetical protein